EGRRPEGVGQRQGAARREGVEGQARILDATAAAAARVDQGRRQGCNEGGGAGSRARGGGGAGAGAAAAEEPAGGGREGAGDPGGAGQQPGGRVPVGAPRRAAQAVAD